MGCNEKNSLIQVDLEKTLASISLSIKYAMGQLK